MKSLDVSPSPSSRLSLVGVVRREEGASRPASAARSCTSRPSSKRDVPLYIESVGALDGYDNADIRARVRGFLRTQAYKDGSRVKAGDLLFTIESTEYAAAVAVGAGGARARQGRARSQPHPARARPGPPQDRA